MTAIPYDNGATPETRLQLADLIIDLQGARVTRGPDEIPLPRLSWGLLRVLVELAPGIVTTETLLDRVWPGLVVNPETVGQRVKLLRAALGDDPREPRYIAVVRGRGWRLASPLVRLAVAADAASTHVAPVSATEPVARRWPMVLAAAIPMAALWGAVLFWQTPREPPVSVSALPASAAAPRAIAVLPFQTLGTRPDDEDLGEGVAESVRYQLDNLRGVTVIARRSSFAEDIRRMDVRSAGARLGAAYLLEGSVQRIGSQLRVNAQLVDTASGTHLWSLQFDRSTRDVFAVQDEIALKIVQSLELSLDEAATQQLLGQGTTNFDAWFEFVQGRSLLAGGRVADLPAAKQHLERAIRMDADFAQPYVELGVTLLRQAEFDTAGDRGAAFAAAKLAAARLFEQAIALDPQDGHARLQRAYLLTFTDLDAAEREYRLGLSMAPNDAAGYEGLATVIYQEPQRYEEVLAALDQARHLDPLEPRYDTTKAGYLFYGRADLDAALALVQKVLEQHPQYAPALNRMSGLVAARGRIAQAIRYNELALQNDPSFDWARRQLISQYLDLGEARAARAVLAEAAHEIPARGLELLIEGGQWRAAGELAFAALETDTVLAFDEPVVALALRRHARVTGEIEPALAALESLSGLGWSSDGEPHFPDYTDLRLYVAGAGDLLLLGGQEERGRRVLQRLLTQVEDARVKLQRGGHWTHHARAVALALLGDTEGAMQALQDSLKGGFMPQRHRKWLDLEPAFDSLRRRADYRALHSEVGRLVQEQKVELQELRRVGLVPTR